MQQAEQELNALDAKVGDGDTGATLGKGAAAVEARLASLPLDDLPAAALALGCALGTMGGTSGAMYKLLFTAAGSTLRQRLPAGPLTAVAAAEALAEGAAAVSKYGGAGPGSRTMLDALLPAAAALKAAAGAGQTAAEAAAAAAAAAAAGVEATKSMAAAVGRSSYVPEAALRGHADPGARVVALWLGAVAASLSA